MLVERRSLARLWRLVVVLLVLPLLMPSGTQHVAANAASSPTRTATTTATRCATPKLIFTYVPPMGSTDILQGRVDCVVAPSNYGVALYIYADGGFWNKPTWADSLTPVSSDGTWSASITTGGDDTQATRIVGYLVKAGYNPPLLSGDPSLPAELNAHAVAQTSVTRTPAGTAVLPTATPQAAYRTIKWSGYTWNVKNSHGGAVGPGPNAFSDSTGNVWVDPKGNLHLKIMRKNGHWYCAEVWTTAPLGLGTYTFTTVSPVIAFAPSVVLGEFTWDSFVPQFNFREIDLELSRWGNSSGPNDQYVIQPYTHSGNRHQFTLPPRTTGLSQSFDWTTSSVQFVSRQQGPSGAGSRIASWTYSGSDIPQPGTGNARINLWLNNGTPPANGHDVEVVLSHFSFKPHPKPAPTKSTPTATNTAAPISRIPSPVSTSTASSTPALPTSTATPTLTPTNTSIPTATATATPCSHPAIAFTIVPAYGTSDNLQGRVSCAAPSLYAVAAYIQVFGGWWTKPFWSEPSTAISAGGTFSVDIVTGGYDEDATQIAAFLVPAGYSPPLMSGDATLPPDLYANAVAQAITTRVAPNS
jgi:hypothetical protein